MWELLVSSYVEFAGLKARSLQFAKSCRLRLFWIQALALEYFGVEVEVYWLKD